MDERVERAEERAEGRPQVRVRAARGGDAYPQVVEEWSREGGLRERSLGHLGEDGRRREEQDRLHERPASEGGQVGSLEGWNK